MRNIVDFAAVVYIDGYLLYCTSLHDGTWRVDIGGADNVPPIIKRNKRKAIKQGREMIKALQAASISTAPADPVKKKYNCEEC